MPLLRRRYMQSIDTKNYFNFTGDNWLNGYFYTSNNVISAYPFNAVVYMPCEPNTTYTISGRTNTKGNLNCSNKVCMCDELPVQNSTRIYGAVEKRPLNIPVTITTSETAKYLVIMCVTDGETVIESELKDCVIRNIEKMMVNKGSVALPYVPCKEVI